MYMKNNLTWDPTPVAPPVKWHFLSEGWAWLEAQAGRERLVVARRPLSILRHPVTFSRLSLVHDRGTRLASFLCLLLPR